MSIGVDLIRAKIARAAGNSSKSQAQQIARGTKRRVTIQMDFSLITSELGDFQPDNAIVELAGESQTVKAQWAATFENVPGMIQQGTAKLTGKVGEREIVYGPVMFHVPQSLKTETLLVFFTPEDKTPAVEAKKEGE